MRRSVRIGIVSAIAVVVVLAVIIQHYSLTSLQEVQFSPRSVGDFDKDTLTLGVEIDACNPTSLPTGFDKMRFELDYKSKEFASMIVQGDTIMPKQSVILHGRIHMNADTVENWWQAYNIFTGFSHEDINLKVTVQAKAFGFIPVSAERNFSYDEFVALVVSPQATQFSCA